MWNPGHWCAARTTRPVRYRPAPPLADMDVRRLGLVPYEEAWALQNRLAGGRRAGIVPDTLILLEHPHTYTIGRSGTRDHVFLSEAEMEARGITCLDVDRGGDVTYHGPGQDRKSTRLNSSHVAISYA